MQSSNVSSTDHDSVNNTQEHIIEKVNGITDPGIPLPDTEVTTPDPDVPSLDPEVVSETISSGTPSNIYNPKDSDSIVPMHLLESYNGSIDGGDAGMLVEHTGGDNGLPEEHTGGDNGLPEEHTGGDNGISEEHAGGDNGLLDNGEITIENVNDLGIVNYTAKEDTKIIIADDETSPKTLSDDSDTRTLLH